MTALACRIFCKNGFSAVKELPEIFLTACAKVDEISFEILFEKLVKNKLVTKKNDIFLIVEIFKNFVESFCSYKGLFLFSRKVDKIATEIVRVACASDEKVADYVELDISL